MADLRHIAQESLASQGIEELEWLLKHVAKVEPKVILEIGVHLGHSMKAWNDAFAPERLVGIDTDLNDTLKEYMKDELSKADLIIGDSHDHKTAIRLVNDVLKGREVDFLFIDGDHTYAGVKQDYEMYAPLVRIGGIIAFHDALIKDHPLVDVHKFLRDIDEKIIRYQSDANGVAIIYR